MTTQSEGWREGAYKAWRAWAVCQPSGARLDGDVQAAFYAGLAAQPKRPSVEATDRVLNTAVSLFRAFAAGVSGKDVREHRMSKEEADRWKTDAVDDFERMLREVALFPPNNEPSP